MLLAVNSNNKSAIKFEKKAIRKTEICKKQAQKTSKFQLKQAQKQATRKSSKNPQLHKKNKPKFAGKPQSWQHWNFSLLLCYLGIALQSSWQNARQTSITITPNSVSPQKTVFHVIKPQTKMRFKQLSAKKGEMRGKFIPFCPESEYYL